MPLPDYTALPPKITYPVKTTVLSKEQEQKYRTWLKRIGMTKENGMAMDENFTGLDYDMRGFFKKYGAIDVKKGQHFTDEFKLPNHKTFSNESIYARGNNAAAAGSWNAQDQFVAPAPYAGQLMLDPALLRALMAQNGF